MNTCKCAVPARVALCLFFFSLVEAALFGVFFLFLLVLRFIFKVANLVCVILLVFTLQQLMFNPPQSITHYSNFLERQNHSFETGRVSSRAIFQHDDVDFVLAVKLLHSEILFHSLMLWLLIMLQFVSVVGTMIRTCYPKLAPYPSLAFPSLPHFRLNAIFRPLSSLSKNLRAVLSI